MTQEQQTRLDAEIERWRQIAKQEAGNRYEQHAAKTAMHAFQMFRDGEMGRLTAGDATPPAPTEAEVLDARRYFGGRLTAEEQAALAAVDLAGVNHAPPATPQPETPLPPVGDMDAVKWAKSFVAHVAAKPEIATDEGTMIGWFANAIMAGYDTAQRRALSPPPDVERLKEAFFRGWGGGFTALRSADLEYQRQQDWEHFAAWALSSTPGEPSTTPTPGAE